MVCPSASLRRGPDGLEFLVARNNAQSCSSTNQIPVIAQFVSQKNQASFCREMHSHGSGMCGEGRQT